jgi:hypothetical protein
MSDQANTIDTSGLYASVGGTDTEDDCMRRAVHAAYGEPFHYLPDPSDSETDEEFWQHWRQWAASRGLRLWISDEWAPMQLARWIACVRGAPNTNDDRMHAVVMGENEFLFDPSALLNIRQQYLYKSLSLTEVVYAIALIPEDVPALEGPFLRIGESDDPAPGMHVDFGSPNLLIERPAITAAANKDQRLAVYGIQGREYDSGNSLSLSATSMGTSGYSGSSTAAQTCVQTLTKAGTISGGTWPLSFEGYTFSASFAHNASTASVQSAIDSAMGAGLITVSGNPALVFSTSSLTGGGSVTLSTTTSGNPAYISSSLYSAWGAICDTGNLTHVGDYRVVARVYDGASTSDFYTSALRLKWSLGDFSNLQINDPVTPQAVGEYALVDMGQVHIPIAPTGTQRWKAMIEGKTSGTAGNSMRIVSLNLFPIGTGSGEVRSIPSSGSTLSMFENFGATSGALTGDTATSGQTWASMGGHVDADDFTQTAAPANAVIRTAVSDTNVTLAYGRGVVLGSSTPTDVTVQVDAKNSDTVSTYMGTIARFVDNDNFAAARIGNGYVGFDVFVAGARTPVSTLWPFTANTTYRLALTIYASGAWFISVDGQRVIGGSNANLATGGVLASGKSGIVDYRQSAVAATRTYSNFSVSIPTAENIACYAGRSIEFRTNEVLRETSTGGVYGVPSIASQPFQPELTPAGAEGLTNRILIQTSRNNPDIGPDTLSDAFTVTVYYEPTWSFARSVQ